MVFDLSKESKYFFRRCTFATGMWQHGYVKIISIFKNKKQPGHENDTPDNHKLVFMHLASLEVPVTVPNQFVTSQFKDGPFPDSFTVHFYSSLTCVSAKRQKDNNKQQIIFSGFSLSLFLVEQTHNMMNAKNNGSRGLALLSLHCLEPFVNPYPRSTGVD